MRMIMRRICVNTVLVCGEIRNVRPVPGPGPVEGALVQVFLFFSPLQPDILQIGVCRL